MTGLDRAANRGELSRYSIKHLNGLARAEKENHLQKRRTLQYPLFHTLMHDSFLPLCRRIIVKKRTRDATEHNSGETSEAAGGSTRMEEKGPNQRRARDSDGCGTSVGGIGGC